MDHPFPRLRGNWWVLSTFYRTVGSLCQGTQPSFTALAIASKTQHLPRAFQAGENSSPALKVVQYVLILMEKPSSEVNTLSPLGHILGGGLVGKHGRGSKLANSFVIISAGTSC